MSIEQETQPETDSGYLQLSDDPAIATYEILDGVNAGCRLGQH